MQDRVLIVLRRFREYCRVIILDWESATTQFINVTLRVHTQTKRARCWCDALFTIWWNERMTWSDTMKCEMRCLKQYNNHQLIYKKYNTCNWHITTYYKAISHKTHTWWNERMTWSDTMKCEMRCGEIWWRGHQYPVRWDELWNEPMSDVRLKLKQSYHDHATHTTQLHCYTKDTHTGHIHT